MFISPAFAATATTAAAEAPSMTEAFLYNAGFIFLIVILFWWAFIRPQQQRMNAHMDMLNKLKVGDRIVTGGGLVGKVSRVIDDNEVEIELSENVKVIALRSTIMDRPADAPLKEKKETKAAAKDKDAKEPKEKK